MRIDDASLSLASSHYQREEHLEEESLRLWVGNERPDFEGNDSPVPAASPAAVIVTLSDGARNLAAQQGAAPPSAEAGDAAAPPTESEDPRLRVIRFIIEALTGKKINVSTFTPTEESTPSASNAARNAEGGQPQRQGWGLEYDYHTRYQEEEAVRFAASGEIHTADGRTIKFNLELNMQRQFVQETAISVRAGDALLVDPLVINFNGTAAQLSDQRFRFDLNADGMDEEMRMLAGGSGFLALDRNNDGVINNGSELFGPATGNGFSELQGLDSDANGWLDENDPMFAEVRIWAGDNNLYRLRDKNVGALRLAPAATPFSLTDNANVLQGKVRETSVYLTEAGQAGTIQELDIAV